MGLIKARAKKAKMPESIIFENFAENRLANKMRIDADCKKFEKDFKVYDRDPYVRELKQDFIEFKNNMVNYLFSVTESEIFAGNLANMSNIAKWHAAFYIYTDKAKTKPEVKNAYLNMRKLFDIMVFITMDHIMYEKGEYIEWDEDGFKHQVDTKYEDLILMMTEVLNHVVMLADAMYDDDRAKVLEVLQFFSDEEFYQIRPSAEDIFDL